MLATENYYPAPFNLPVSPGQMKIILILLDLYKFKPKRVLDPKRHLRSIRPCSSLCLKELPGSHWLQLRQNWKLLSSNLWENGCFTNLRHSESPGKIVETQHRSPNTTHSQWLSSIASWVGSRNGAFWQIWCHLLICRKSEGFLIEVMVLYI